MRGSIVRRSRTSWAIVLDIGRVNGRRKQRWVKFAVRPNEGLRDATKRAQSELARLLNAAADGTFVDPCKTTLAEYLRDWAARVRPMRRPQTGRVHACMIAHVAKAPIGSMPLQKVRASDLEAFYASVPLAPVSVAGLHSVIHRAMRMAVRDRLLAVNPAAAVENRPKAAKDHGIGAREHCWSAPEARAFLAAAHGDDIQTAAFFSLALDSGARKNELLGLSWDRVDLDSGAITIDRQIDDTGPTPTWGPTKTGKSRTVLLGDDAIARLRAHRKHQAELKMANRTTYTDHGLVFAKEAGDQTTPGARLGDPCSALARRHFARLTKAAGCQCGRPQSPTDPRRCVAGHQWRVLRRIKFHGLRHTTATLLLASGVPPQVVAQRLGHANVVMTMTVYAHALPDMQADAARRLGAVLAAGQ